MLDEPGVGPRKGKPPVGWFIRGIPSFPAEHQQVV